MKICHFKLIMYLFTAAIFGICASPTWAEKAYYWEKTYGVGVGKSVQQTTDGGFIVAGRVSESACLIKTDADGNEMWIKTFGEGEASSVQQTTDGGYIFIMEEPGWEPAHLIKTNPEGTLMWTKVVADDNGSAVVQQTNDGGYILGVRDYCGSDCGWICSLVKTDDKGDTLWSRGLNNGEFCGPVNSVQQTADGGYIILHEGLLKTDAEGNDMWKNSEIHGNSMQQTTDGGYIVGGEHLIKTDADGNEVWRNSIGVSPIQQVQQTTDGGYIAVGDVGPSCASDVYLVKTDPRGNPLWSKTFGGGADDSGYSVDLTTDSGNIITGNKGSSIYLIYYKPPGMINEYVTFSPIRSTYKFIPDTEGCPAGFVGKFSFDAALDNESDNDLWKLMVEIAQLSNGNLLLTDGGLIGQGERFEVPQKGAYADGRLNIGESVEVPFTVCLKNREPFKFYVNVFGNGLLGRFKGVVWKGDYDINNIDDLLALSGYTIVTGDLNIRDTSLTSLEEGLSSLESVCGHLNIVGNDLLASLEGLDSLTSVGGLSIDDNDSLTNLQGLNNLTSVGGTLSISNNDSLINLEGLNNLISVEDEYDEFSKSISNNDSLISLQGLNNLTSVGGTLSISNNDSLINLEGLNNLTSVGGLSIDDNDSLTSLEGLNNLTSVYRLRIWDNDSLTSLEGLNNLTSVKSGWSYGLSISNNDSLTSLEGLNSLTSVGTGLYISGNYSLTSLEGLDSLTSVGGLSIDDNDSLTSLEGLDNLTSVKYYFSISENDSLTSLEGLNNLTSVGGSVWHSLSIGNNDSLTSLEGLNNLTSVGGDLSIRDNDSLTSLGLYSLNFVGDDFGIYENLKLCTSLAEELRDQVLSGGGIGGEIVIRDNKNC